MLNGQETLPPCDYWAWAVVLYEMICGKRPFHDASEYLIFQRILKLRYSFFDNQFPEDEIFAKDLFTKIFIIEPEKRLKYDEIRFHKYFDSVKNVETLPSSESPFLNI